MKGTFQYIIIGLTLLGCSESLDKLAGKNLYSYSDNQEFFPDEIKQNKDFYAKRFSVILMQLDERSLVDKYFGHEIVRLTVVRSFRNHFTILVEKTDNGVLLTEKETYRDSRPVNNGDTTKITYEVIEFDSVTSKYMEVRKYMPVGTRPAVEIETQRKVIDPIIRKESRELRSEEWNNLSKLLSNKYFWEMYPADSVRGFDGNHFILETHSENGYYVVYRWGPDSGDFKTIIDYIIGLSTYKEQ
jgi:hypothetical protein